LFWTAVDLYMKTKARVATKEKLEDGTGMERRHLAHTLRLDGVSKHYGLTKAVDKVSLTVPNGEFITLLGPSGSGKTTILMMVAGFYPPTRGEILLEERPITHLPPEKRNFGMVFQGYALFPHMTVFDNIAFPLRMRRRPLGDIKRRVDELLELVQLTSFCDRLPRMLSGGQQQRVALARALVFTPDILLLDEPLGALDRKLRASVQVELKLVHQRVGTTFIYVTHDQEEALAMSSRIAIIREGRLVQVGSPHELYERPATRFVADFLGRSNFIRGMVSKVYDSGFTYRVGQESFQQSATTGGVRAGEEVLIAIRPEKISLTEAPLDSAANRVAGQIRNWNYFGDKFQSTIRTATLGDLTAVTPTWRCSVEPVDSRPVWLNWDDDASVVVKDD